MESAESAESAELVPAGLVELVPAESAGLMPAGSAGQKQGGSHFPRRRHHRCLSLEDHPCRSHCLLEDRDVLEQVAFVHLMGQRRESPQLQFVLMDLRPLRNPGTEIRWKMLKIAKFARECVIVKVTRRWQIMSI